MELFIFSWIIFVIVCLLDIKFGFVIRECIMDIRSYDNDKRVSVGDMLTTILVGAIPVANLLLSFIIALMWVGGWIYRHHRKVTFKFLSKRLF